MRFVETPIFTARVGAHLDDESYRALQLALALRPEQGALIRGSGGLRKLRWGATGRGKRGGLRVIYHWNAREDVAYMLFVYAKNEQGDLTAAQVKALSRLVREELG
jgi:hypothetical protein